MGASSVPARFVVLAVICALPVNCCLRLDRWIKAGKCSEFNDIKEKFLEGSVTSVKEEACLFQELKSPTLEDLSVMFKALSNGVVPEYIQDNNYSSFGKGSTNYTYSYGNVGTVDGMLYGVFQKDGQTTSHSALEFRFIRGSVGSFNYTAGQALFSHVRYSIEDNVLKFQASTLGGLLFRKPSDGYVLYGNYTGLSDGEATLLGETSSYQIHTLAILDIPQQYYSRDTVYLRGRANYTHHTSKGDVYSVTGGTNSTIDYTGDAQTGDDSILTMKGTLVNSNKEATVEGRSHLIFSVNKSYPFSDHNLPMVFSFVRAVIGMYLP